MTSELDLDKIRRSAEPGAMFGAIIVRDLVDRLEQVEQLARINNQAMLAQAQRAGQAEQDRDKLRNRLDAMRRQRDGYRNQLRKARTNQGGNNA